MADGADFTFSLSDATGVSPTRPKLGALAGAMPRSAQAPAGIAGRQRSTDSHRGGGGGRPAGSLPGDRRLSAHRGAGAIGPGHGGSGGLAVERARGRVTGACHAHVAAHDGAGGSLAAAGTGAALRVRCGGSGAPLRSQPRLGVAPSGLARTAAGRGPAARAHGRDHSPPGDEVPGADGQDQPRG